MSQTLCKTEVFPAFDLPMMRTLNCIFVLRGESGRARDRAEDDDGAGDGGDGAGAGAGAGAGDRAGDDVGAGDGGGDGTRQQVLCFTPITRKYGEKKDWVIDVDHLSESGLVIIHTVQT